MSTRARNPFTLKVGQLMTGFGVGCGIGLGVGYPIALGSIPVLGEMMSATSRAGSQAFGGLSHKAFGMLRKLGLKNLNAGVGCGVGIGHGFGVGIALKPHVSQQLVQFLQERLSAGAGQLQKHLPRGRSEYPEATDNVPTESQRESTAEESFPGNRVATPNKSTGYVLSEAFPVVTNDRITVMPSRGDEEELQELRKENEILHTLLKHQQLIDDLNVQNASVLRLLSEQFDLQIGGQGVGSDINLEATPSHRVARKEKSFHYFHSHSNNSIRKCFECRITARRRR